MEKMERKAEAETDSLWWGHPEAPPCPWTAPSGIRNSSTFPQKKGGVGFLFLHPLLPQPHLTW